MTNNLRFLPEVEDDVIGGYVWYEVKSRGLGEEFLRMFYICAVRFLGVHCFTQKFMASSVDVYSKNFHTLSIS